MVTGDAIWPGRSDVDQLFLIIQTLGPLLPRYEQIYNNNEYFRGLAIPIPQDMIPLERKINNNSPLILDFLKKCFEYNPDKRPSAGSLLEHSYFNNVQLPPEVCSEVPGKKKAYAILPYLNQNSPIYETKLKSNFTFNNNSNKISYLPVI